MFKLCLDNGLPAKPFKFVDHFDDYEETDEYKKTNINLSKPVKFMILNSIQIDKEIGNFKKLYFVNNQLWIELEKSYVVCDKLSKKTVDFIKDKKFIVLGFFEINEKGDTIKILRKEIDFI